MKFRRIIALAIILLSLMFGQAIQRPVFAKYGPLTVSNNRFGIHILEPGEIEKAAAFVNSNGGEWGYVTIPIRVNDLDLDKWTKFMNDCSRLKVIPILRIASYPKDASWVAPNEWDLVDFSNFLSDLPWPIRNRYVIVYNEPNHKNEWGGFVNPSEYARVLSRAADIFHKKHEDYFIIGAGMDSSAPTSNESLNIYSYFTQMDLGVPGIFKQIDGMSYHSYGNPAFSASPNLYSLVNVNGFRNEVDYLKQRYDVDLPIFLTEAGWNHDQLSDNQMTTYYDYAFTNVWTDDVVSVTPFLLQAGDGPFKGFSFINKDGDNFDFAKKIMSYQKNKGMPQIAQYIAPVPNKPPISDYQPSNEKVVGDWTKLIQWVKKFFNI